MRRVHDSSCGLRLYHACFAIALQILLDGPTPSFRSRSALFLSEHRAELRHGYDSNRIELIFQQLRDGRR